MLEVLREQIRTSNVAEVSFSGVGFFAEFEVPATATKTEPADISGGSAYFELNNTKHGGGCVLFVRQGFLATLEGFSYVDPWLEDTQILEIKDVEPILT